MTAPSADQLQITKGNDGTYIVSALNVGAMMPRLFTAQNAAQLAGLVRELFEGPVSEIPAVIASAFERDHDAATLGLKRMLGMLGGDEDDEDDEDDEEDEEELTPLDPGWNPMLF